MRWAGQIDGPVPSPIYGAPDEAGLRPFLGFEAGYRVNITPQLLAACPELEPYRVAPESPQRIWAGDEAPWPQTVFLLFADEAEARASALGEYWIDEGDPEDG